MAMPMSSPPFVCFENALHGLALTKDRRRSRYELEPHELVMPFTPTIPMLKQQVSEAFGCKMNESSKVRAAQLSKRGIEFLRLLPNVVKLSVCKLEGCHVRIVSPQAQAS